MKSPLFLFPLLVLLVCATYTPAQALDAFPQVSELPYNENLPDPFVMFDGTPVKTPEQWYKQRRPELKQLFQYYMYGFMPEPPKVRCVVTKTEPNVLGGKATLKEIEIRFPELPDNAPKIHLALFVPNGKKGPFPVFLGLNSHGNQTVVDDQAVTFNDGFELSERDKKNGVNQRGALKTMWCVEQHIDRGYAFAVYCQCDIDPDKNDFTDGIHPFYNLPYPKDAQWGTISAWAWGLHRCVDYLVYDDDVDRDRICLIGHSRRGKTVLLASALDERVALVVPHQSGTGGCALSRYNDQETVERINRVFPHWFNGNFKKFNNNEAQIPFDQHLLVSLVAPRAVLDTAGLQDTWANYESALKNLRAADKVYKFLGTPGLIGDGVINGEQPINEAAAGNLLQYRRDLPHTLNIEYWNRIWDYADAYFAKRDRKIGAAYPTVGEIERFDPAIDQLIPKDAKIEWLAGGFDWTEGPLWIKDGGYLLFSDIPANAVIKWKEGEGASIYLKPAGYTGSESRLGEAGSNGLLLDPEGRLVLCQHGNRCMAYMDAPIDDPMPKFIALADRYEGKRFNSPNDAVYHKNGDLYFTDPPYGLPQNADDPSKELDFQGVFRLSKDGVLTLITKELSRPNGIAFSPDYKTLYVVNSDGNQAVRMAFDVANDGSVGKGRFFCEGAGDGMKVDARGNLFSTGGGGVQVISPKGKLLGTIKTGRATSNCAFGDDGKTLYITADDDLLRIRLTTKGAGF